MLQLLSNIDCLQTLTSFPMTVVTQVLTGAFLSIQSIWLANHPHCVNDVIKQVLLLFQYTCLPWRTCTCMQDLAWNVTWHNKTIVWKVGSEEQKMSKIKHYLKLFTNRQIFFCIVHIVNQQINYYFSFTLIC